MVAAVSTKSEIDRAKRLVRFAGKQAKQLEENIRELVNMRAWEILGHENFSAMWEVENGFKAPTYAKVLAVEAIVKEGMQSQGRKSLPDRTGVKYVPQNSGHSNSDVAKMVGLPVEDLSRYPGAQSSNTVSSIRWQLKENIPREEITLGKARGKNRRIGKSPNEVVSESFSLFKSDADLVFEIARQANTTKSEIYRQAVAEYLARHAASRPTRTRKA